MSFRIKSSLILCALGAVGMLLAPGLVPLAAAQSKQQMLVCAKRGGKGWKRAMTDAIEVMADCQVDSLKDDERTNCAIEEDVLDDLDKAADKLRREMKKCDDDALRALCPHGEREDTALKEAVLNGAGGTFDRLSDLDANVFTTSYGGCPRPLGEISSLAEDCADRISKLMEDSLDEFAKCLIKCELNAMRKSGEEPCLDDITGAPNDQKISDCFDRVLDDVDDGLTQRCDDATIVELGCPLGFSAVADVIPELTDRLFDEAVHASEGIFFSECGENGGSGSEGGETDPVAATLYPSETVTQIDCGQTLDAAFFGSDDEVRLDADLDCGPAGKDSHGIIVSASGVTVDGRSDYEITGPARSSNRTGAAILIAPGATNVTVSSFRKIQRYAVGVLDSGDNDGLEIEDLTVRRQKEAGIRTTSPNVTIDNVKSDRNPVGFDVSGDDSTIADCRALRSEPAPNIGIWVHGSDTDSDDQVVRINRCDAEGNVVGILVAEGPHLLEDNVVRFNDGDGIQVTASGAKVESNSVKLNGGNGIVVSGDANLIVANRSDENIGHGFVVSGIANDISDNQAGSLTDQGNVGHGFWFTGGFDTNIETNTAEANGLNGFQIDEDSFDVKSNTAKENAGVGIAVSVAGNNLDTNRSEDNVGFEFSISAGNVDDSGNTADGATISFGAGGGDF